MQLTRILLKLVALDKQISEKYENADKLSENYAELAIYKAYITGVLAGAQIVLDESGDTAKEFFNKFENNGTEFSGEKIYKE